MTIQECIETDEIRLGALACIRSLTIIEHIGTINGRDVEGTLVDEQLRTKQDAISKILNNIEDLTPKVKGYLLTMAEYIFTVHEAGLPELNNWKPFCAMTEREYQEYIVLLNEG